MKIDLQIASRSKNIPSLRQFKKWVTLALQGKHAQEEMVIRIVDRKESAKLNAAYRNKIGPTNVLSFYFSEDSNSNWLGDLVICAPVVKMEAAQQGKTLLSHWAHLVIHGTLHLRGYDHIKKKEAERMEKLEIQLMRRLGYPDPYKEQN